MNIYNEIFTKNNDLLKRMSTEKVKAKYLKSDDVFMVTLDNSSKESDSVEIADGLVVVHYNPDSFKIIGFTVPYVEEFRETFKEFEKVQAKVEKPKETISTSLSPTRVASSALFGLSYAF